MQKQVVGEVLGLFISKNVTKEQKDSIFLDENGIVNDKFYGKNIQRSVLLVSRDSYKLVKQNNIEIKYGQLGENILIDYNPYGLEIGSQLQIGQVVLQISQRGTLCKSLSKVDPCLAELLKEKRGIFAKVISGGEIIKNDKISLLETH
jgi:MOSC domain-containing protein YiiM